LQALNPLLLLLLKGQVEILLNLAWAALALLLVGLWLRIGDRTGADRRRQIVAIVVLIAILFPVISVSDDLMAVQNATEQDGSQRRDHLASPSAHAVLPFAAIVSVLNLDSGFGSVRFLATHNLPLPSIDHPELASIENRPPPSA
jgi:hypothetical protein